MTKPIIEIKNLSAGYDGRNVLHDINLAVYERDFLGIIGPNGGGKTTLVKCILGLLKPTGGEISFNCKPSLGYLPQYSTIDRKFPISVEEVILSGLSIQKSLTSRFTPEQKEKGKQIIARMGLEGLEHRAIGQLSGGQLQRALLGRAIISDPSVLDFKFGKENPKYNKQVKGYMQLLTKMGYKNITGYLWYVDEEKIEKV